MSNLPEIVLRDALYTSCELKKRLRLGEAGWRRMKKDGLRTARLGKTCVVRGEDVLRYAAELAERQNGGDA